jgi:hypothetical protein
MQQGHRKKHHGCWSQFVRYSIWIFCFFLIMLTIVVSTCSRDVRVVRGVGTRRACSWPTVAPQVNAKYIDDPRSSDSRTRFKSKAVDFDSSNLDDFINYFPTLVLLCFSMYTGLSFWRCGAADELVSLWFPACVA